MVSGLGRIILAGALLGALGGAAVRAQTVLGDPRDAAKIFASNCSACHKSPQGLAKSGQVAGFLRQHYTTGPEMSASMAAYLVAAGNAPASKKGAAAAETASRQKSKKGEQLAAQTPENTDAVQPRTLRGKQRHGKEEPAHTSATHQPAHTPPAEQPAAHETKQAAAQQAAASAPPAAVSAPQPAAAAAPPAEAPVVLNVPMPELPEGPPADLVQSFFSSSPLP